MRYFVVIGFVVISVIAGAQNLSTLRSRVLSMPADSVVKDSLVMTGIKILDKDGITLPDNFFSPLSSGKGVRFQSMYFDQLQGARLIYRVIPQNFTDPFYHKLFVQQQQVDTAIFSYSLPDPNNQTNEGRETMIRQGSISRGVNFGNNQDVSVNSGLNLQLSGRLSEDIAISAAITDRNIPLQPDGNTQQIQDFDKVYITLSSKNVRLTAGDIELKKPEGYFLRLNRKVQGGQAIFSTSTGNSANKLSISGAGAVSKGKYNRMAFAGTEGVQGPYRLKGANNETYIIILAGSETVYINGKMMERGENQDYIIDYNTAELRFMAKQVITKDSRIVVEFEYTERSYARFLGMAGTVYSTEKSTTWFNVFVEQDAKNQYIQQDLDENDKRVLSAAGDNPSLAWVPNVLLDTVFRNDQVFYSMIDTVVGSIVYDSVFVYSTDPSVAQYRLGFSLVGQGKGNYRQISSLANGRVFEWVAPVGGVLQGDYEPVRLLTAPVGKKVITAGSDIKLGNYSRLELEAGLSDNDQNLFSEYDDKDNTGAAFRMKAEQLLWVSDTSSARTAISGGFQWLSNSFNPADRYRDAEFERDWNLGSSSASGGEGMAMLGMSHTSRKHGGIAYNLEGMEKFGASRGLRNSLNGQWKTKHLLTRAKGSLLQTETKSGKTYFLRYQGGMEYMTGMFYAGTGVESEENRWTGVLSDSLTAASFSYFQYEGYSGIRDSSGNPIHLFYKKRMDQLPFEGRLKRSTSAEDIGVNARLWEKNKSPLLLTVTYRNLKVEDSLTVSDLPAENLTARLEQSLRIMKGFLQSALVYETGSGLEPLLEFSYLEVQPGLGVYRWTDYNGNGLKELDEFEIAAFKDEALYIRINSPTGTYTKVSRTRFSHSLSVSPDRIWGGKEGIRKFVSKFSDQLAWSMENKNRSESVMSRWIPVPVGIPDSLMLGNDYSVRNTFSFQRSDPRWGCDYIFLNSEQSQLLLGGEEMRRNLLHTLKARVSLSASVTTTLSVETGGKSYESDFFTNKNYTVSNRAGDLAVNYQLQSFFRITVDGKLQQKDNESGTEKGTILRVGTEFRFSKPERGNLTIRLDVYRIEFTGNVNSSVGYEMLAGLQPGNNTTWQVQYQRNLTETLQLSLLYSGRQAADIPVVHTGSVQLRAYF